MNNEIAKVVKNIIYLCCLMALPLSAQAASFDCAKAANKIGKIICADAELSKLDEELSAAYKTALQDEAQAVSTKQAQRLWMNKRNGCADANCVKRAYELRLSMLAVKSEKKAGNNLLSAGWDYKQEGGGMGTEPYTIGGDDEWEWGRSPIKLNNEQALR